MYIVQCDVTATKAGDRPIPPPSAWRIPPLEDTIESVVDDLLEGHYNNPVRVIVFNPAERSSRDVSEDVVHELWKRCADQDRELPEFLEGFIKRHESAKAFGRPREHLSTSE